MESGFDVFNGSVDNNRLFNRQAWVGLSGSRWGEVTLGRQYDSMVDYLSPLSLANMDDKQRTFGAGASYVFAPATVGFGYIQSKIDGAQGFGNSPMPAASATSDVNVSNYELNGKYSLTPA